MELATGYYTRRKPWLLGGFDWAAAKIRPIAIRHYGERLADVLAVEARQEFEALIPQLPYIGGSRNPHTPLIVGAAMFLALYRPLKARDRPVQEIGALASEAVETVYGLFPRSLFPLYGRRTFSRHTLRRAHKRALESQQRRYRGDWVYTVVEGDGSAFDWGIDYVECGICKLYHAQGADEFVPYLCQLDFIASAWFGWGLGRTMTLAEGNEKCDFRFTRTKGRIDF